LSGYPRPLLNGRLPLLILALLERGGLVTEPQLIKEAGEDERLVKEALFDLSLGKLIEYGSNHIRLTEKGKEIIDRFQLDKEAVGEVLDMLSLEGEEREIYQLALRAYRNISYLNYLNSISSLRALKYIADLALLEVGAHTQAETRSGMFVFLTNDIAHWWKRISIYPIVGQLPSAVVGHCSFISTKLTEWSDSDDETLLTRYTRALNAPSSELFGRIENKDPERTPAVQCVSDFFNFRLRSETSGWFDQWAELTVRVPEAFPDQSGHYLEAIQHELAQMATRQVTLAARYDSDPRFNAESYFTGEANTFLESLLTARSMQELTRLSGMSYQTLKLLIEKIAHQCQVLLEGSAIP
jgi:hypothetical protein